MLKKFSRRLSSEQVGFTLLEIMIAAGVMVIGFVLIFGGVLSISDVGELSEKRAIAMADLSTIMEEIREADYSELLAYEPAAPQGLGADATVEVTCFDADGDPITLPVNPDELAEPLPNPCEVRATVTWRDNKGRTLAETVSGLNRR